jgi:hypothetical protein
MLHALARAIDLANQVREVIRIVHEIVIRYTTVPAGISNCRICWFSLSEFATAVARL